MSRRTMFKAQARTLVDQATQKAGNNSSPIIIWSILHREILSPSIDFAIHKECYELVYGETACIKPAWIPTNEIIMNTNIYQAMLRMNFQSYQQLYNWSIQNREEFWMTSMKIIDIVWDTAPSKVFTSEIDPINCTYFPGGKLNITDSCFHKRLPQEEALIYATETHPRHLKRWTFGYLDRLSNQIAHSIQCKLCLHPGDAIAICMPMTPESVAIYLGIIKLGCIVVSIADSFSSFEISIRCRLGNAKAIVTQDVINRGSKYLPLYSRVLEAVSEPYLEKSIPIVVLPAMLHVGSYSSHEDEFSERGGKQSREVTSSGDLSVNIHCSVVLRASFDLAWYEFLKDSNDSFVSVKCSSMDPCNILFSSGTTGEPKAIVWSHSTPIKCAIDGFYHQDIKLSDRVVWPTNIGWMMGPWLLFQMINGATIGIFNGITSNKSFCEFVDESKMTLVGVIPSLVKSWQARNATNLCDWSSIRRFSSTGEASDPENYLWLMSCVKGYSPVIEYCGGTEIGGSFLSSTLVQPNVPSMFSSPVLGSQLYLLNESSAPMEESCYSSSKAKAKMSGEIAIVPPSIGLSTHLLNRNHFNTYFSDMPRGPRNEILRRHGDEILLLSDYFHFDDNVSMHVSYYRALGRCDDTMNIGGIKVSSIEIERVCNLVHGVKDTAAIAVSSYKGGPSSLVVYVVLSNSMLQNLKEQLQQSIKLNLNPLFTVSDIVTIKELPRTASNKVMRRLLRSDYLLHRLENTQLEQHS
jgi:acetyl-CoA synthetase